MLKSMVGLEKMRREGEGKGGGPRDRYYVGITSLRLGPIRTSSLPHGGIVICEIGQAILVPPITLGCCEVQ